MEQQKEIVLSAAEQEVGMTLEEKASGWKVAYCAGNGYKRGCRRPYKTLNWFTPSGCPHCNATFVD